MVSQLDSSSVYVGYMYCMWLDSSCAAVVSLSFFSNVTYWSHRSFSCTCTFLHSIEIVTYILWFSAMLSHTYSMDFGIEKSRYIFTLNEKLFSIYNFFPSQAAEIQQKWCRCITRLTFKFHTTHDKLSIHLVLLCFSSLYCTYSSDSNLARQMWRWWRGRGVGVSHNFFQQLVIERWEREGS